ncbi:MAG: sensor histidine kinase [Candidatus Nomurabacteria bacterium]|jgi:signal transduction histidine kinase|nr:sensor histidine kinase [Candidatus Nomurabacteria bacterium]
MQDLTISLLNLAKSEDKKPKAPVDVSKITENILKQNRRRLEGKTLTIEIAKNVSAKTDSEDLRQLFTILIDNAIKYSDQRIDLRLASGSLTIENDGATIPATELPKIFDRFYRADKSRHSDGFGLGLSIAKNIVEKYNWQIYVSSSDQKTKFTIVFDHHQLPPQNHVS